MELSTELSPSQARQAMISALLAVSDRLTPDVRSALNLAASTNDSCANERARVSLWQSLGGHAMGATHNVLCTRLAICTLYPNASVADTKDTIEYFVNTYRLCKLPEGVLARAFAAG
jgi:hypothetical protein